MTDELRQAHADVRAAIARLIALTPGEVDDEPADALESAMVTRWVVVAEMLAANDGDRWLCLRHGDSIGGTLKSWDAIGLCHAGANWNDL